MRKVIVMKKEPGKAAEKSTLRDDYKEIQKYVGGIFQSVPMPRSETINILCADEGKLDGMPSNIFLPEYNDMVVGNVIFTAYNDEGEIRDLTENEICMISKYCENNKAREIDPNSTEYQSYMRVEVYFDNGSEDEKEDLDMGD